MKGRLFALLLALSLASPGCIVVPMSGAPRHNRFVDVVGGRDSSAPLRVDVSTQQQVQEVLGHPEWVSRPEVLTGTVVWHYRDLYVESVTLLVGGEKPIQSIATRGYELSVIFGRDGRIERYEVYETR